MRHSSIDRGLLATAVGGTVLGMAAAILALSVWNKTVPDAGRAEAGHTPSLPKVAAGAERTQSGIDRRSVSSESGGADRASGLSTAKPEGCPGDERSFQSLFDGAQVSPTYQQREMIGVQIFGIRPGTFWETLGIQAGDLVINMDSAQIDSIEASVALLKYVGTSRRIHLKVRALDGRERLIAWEAPLEADPATLSPHCRS